MFLVSCYAACVSQIAASFLTTEPPGNALDAVGDSVRQVIAKNRKPALVATALLRTALFALKNTDAEMMAVATAPLPESNGGAANYHL